MIQALTTDTSNWFPWVSPLGSMALNMNSVYKKPLKTKNNKITQYCRFMDIVLLDAAQ